MAQIFAASGDDEWNAEIKTILAICWSLDGNPLNMNQFGYFILSYVNCRKSIKCILPGGITLPIAAVTGYCTVSARATEFEINPTVLSRTSAAHTFSAAFHVNGRKCAVHAVVVVAAAGGLLLLRPLPHRAAAERWVDVMQDTHIFLSPPVAQWCHCSGCIHKHKMVLTNGIYGFLFFYWIYLPDSAHIRATSNFHQLPPKIKMELNWYFY